MNHIMYTENCFRNQNKEEKVTHLLVTGSVVPRGEKQMYKNQIKKLAVMKGAEVKIIGENRKDSP